MLPAIDFAPPSTACLLANRQITSALCAASALLLATIIPCAAPCAAQTTRPTPQAPSNTTQPQPLPPIPGPQAPPAPAPPQLPDAIPQPLKPALTAILSGEQCLLRNTGATLAETASMRALAVSGLNAVSSYAGSTPVVATLCVPHVPIINWYARFLNGPEVKPLTPQEKAWLAVHNLIDPFNLLTIGADAAVAVGANSHSAYGPGLPGWGRYMGVSFTQDMTGEFFGTFLIPSLVHQDPHYHREPHATIKRRIAHATLAVLWTQGDNDRGMVNWANIAGFAVDGQISNLYVPGQAKRASATASRYGIALATAPIDNYVSEFLPDLARHFHIQVVVIQRIINQVARNDSSAP